LKVDFVIPNRNKARWVGRAMSTAMAQNYPCRVVVSDQGSTDGSLDVIKTIAAEGGRNPVEILHCPVQHYRGMPGFNLHLNWIHEQLDGDLVVICSADDYVAQGRVADAVRAVEEHGADVVLSSNRFEEEDGTCYGYSPSSESGFVTLRQLVETKLGGSAAQSWTLKFWNAVGGMPLFPGCDMFLPHLAATQGKCYYVANPTHVYVRHIDPNNTGLESVALATPEAEGASVAELMAFHRMTGIVELLRRGNAVNKPDDVQILMEDMIAVAAAWVDARQSISEAGIAPRQFPMLLPARPDGAVSEVVNH